MNGGAMVVNNGFPRLISLPLFIGCALAQLGAWILWLCNDLTTARLWQVASWNACGMLCAILIEWCLKPQNSQRRGFDIEVRDDDES